MTREGAIRYGTSKEITRGTHLTAVYPAFFSLVLVFLVHFPFAFLFSQRLRIGFVALSVVIVVLAYVVVVALRLVVVALSVAVASDFC